MCNCMGNLSRIGKPRDSCQKIALLHNNISLSDSMSTKRGCRGRDRVEIEFTTTCAISSYDHLSCEFEPRSWRGVLHITVCDKIC